jgi:hypothetical protein
MSITCRARASKMRQVTTNARKRHSMTYTLRTTTALGGQLSSGQMRSWIAEFLRRPHPLPADPGAGEYRLSLNLSDESVRDLAGLLRCSSSSALRRIALNALQSSPALSATQTDYAGSGDSARARTNRLGEGFLPVMTEGEILGMLVMISLLLSFAFLLFVIYRKRKRRKNGRSHDGQINCAISATPKNSGC